MHRRFTFIVNTAEVFQTHRAQLEYIRPPMALLFGLSTQLCMGNLVSRGHELIPCFHEQLTEDDAFSNEPWYPKLLASIESHDARWLEDLLDKLITAFRFALQALASKLDPGFFFSGITYTQMLGCDAQFEFEISGSRHLAPQVEYAT